MEIGSPNRSQLASAKPAALSRTLLVEFAVVYDNEANEPVSLRPLEPVHRCVIGDGLCLPEGNWVWEDSSNQKLNRSSKKGTHGPSTNEQLIGNMWPPVVFTRRAAIKAMPKRLPISATK